MKKFDRMGFKFVGEKCISLRKDEYGNPIEFVSNRNRGDFHCQEVTVIL